jgi:hypothetical protein
MKVKNNQKLRSNCKKIRFRNKGSNTYLSYSRPVNKNDLKRYGKSLVIESNGFKIHLNGRQINSIKVALRNVGEIGKKVNKDRCNIW